MKFDNVWTYICSLMIKLGQIKQPVPPTV